MRRIQAKARATGRGLIENLEQRTLLSTIYVNAAAGGAVPDGSTWQQAFTDLHSALAAAGTGDEIWVAAGTYKPTDGMPNPNDRNVSFHLKNQVGVYGGFNGTESTRAQRDWSANVTTLSGDIGAIGDVADNSASVITNSNIDSMRSSTALPSQPATGGPAACGTSIVRRPCPTSSFATTWRRIVQRAWRATTVPRCSLTARSSTTSPAKTGGPLRSSTRRRCSSTVASSATPAGGGGAVLNAGSSATKFINTTFRQNSIKVSPYTSVPFGGAIENIGASLTLTNCTFIGNSSEARRSC